MCPAKIEYGWFLWFNGSLGIWRCYTRNKMEFYPCTHIHHVEGWKNSYIFSYLDIFKFFADFTCHLFSKAAFSAPYYRIIFGMLDTICQMIGNHSVLLILQLSIFQSKIILRNNLWTYVNGINMEFCQKFLERSFSIKNCQKPKINNINFFIVAALNRNSNYVDLSHEKTAAAISVLIKK